MPDREIIKHWKDHYDRVAQELSEANFKIMKMKEQIRRLKVTRFESMTYYGEIDFENGSGWFEDKEYGEDGGCGSYKFDSIIKDGKAYHTIYDYDNCYDIPKEVKSALLQHNIITLNED